MMTPREWNQLIVSDAPMRAFKDAAQRCALEFLASVPKGKEIKTEQLVEGLYPRAVADQSLQGDLARKRIYIVIYKLASNGLEDCARKGEVSGEYMGKPKRPWLWFNPGNLEVCFACGHVNIIKGDADESGASD